MIVSNITKDVRGVRNLEAFRVPVSMMNLTVKPVHVLGMTSTRSMPF
jgi:hypothetical protein